MISHFLLYTGWGSVLTVAVASGVVALVVWCVVVILTSLIARAAWHAYHALRG